MKLFSSLFVDSTVVTGTLDGGLLQSSRFGKNVESRGYILAPEVAHYVAAASQERLQAGRMLLADIYSGERPSIFEECPEVELAIKTSPYFMPSRVGCQALRNCQWDMELDLDWTVQQCSTSNQFEVKSIESDSGGVGGFVYSALIYEEFLKSIAWNGGVIPQDGSDYFKRYLAALSTLARKEGGRAAVYWGADMLPLLEGIPVLQEWHASSDVLVLGPWNRGQLDYSGKGLVFSGLPISVISLRFPIEILDPSLLEYGNVQNELQTQSYREQSLQGFWQRWLEGLWGFTRIINPIGSHLFIDKAIVGLLPTLVRYYLGQEPLITSPKYYPLYLHDLKLNTELAAAIEASPEKWVIKERKVTGEGRGTHILRYLSDARHVDLLAAVAANPVDYVAQEFIEDYLIAVGSSRTRTIEFRTIAWSIDGRSEVLPQVVARTSPSGEPRTSAGRQKNSLLPVLLPAN